MSRQKEFEREETLEKALDVFWTKGYNKTSFQDLTEGMCVNRQSIYDTYGDKHALFIEALNYYYDKNNASTGALVAQDKPVKQLLSTFFDNVININTGDKKNRGCMLQNATNEMLPDDKEVAEIVNRNIAANTQNLQALINRGIKTGEIKPDANAQALDLFLLNTVQGIITLSKSVSDKKKLRAIADTAIEAVVKG